MRLDFNATFEEWWTKSEQTLQNNSARGHTLRGGIKILQLGKNMYKRSSVKSILYKYIVNSVIIIQWTRKDPAFACFSNPNSIIETQWAFRKTIKIAPVPDRKGDCRMCEHFFGYLK